MFYYNGKTWRCFWPLVWNSPFWFSLCRGCLFSSSSIELRVQGREKVTALVRRRQLRCTTGKTHTLSIPLSSFFSLALSLPSKHLSLSYSSPKYHSLRSSASEQPTSDWLSPELPAMFAVSSSGFSGLARAEPRFKAIYF